MQIIAFSYFCTPKAHIHYSNATSSDPREWLTVFSVTQYEIFIWRGECSRVQVYGDKRLSTMWLSNSVIECPPCQWKALYSSPGQSTIFSPNVIDKPWLKHDTHTQCKLSEILSLQSSMSMDAVLSHGDTKMQNQYYDYIFSWSTLLFCF